MSRIYYVLELCC